MEYVLFGGILFFKYICMINNDRWSNLCSIVFI